MKIPNCKSCGDTLLHLGRIGSVDFYACGRCHIEYLLSCRDQGTFDAAKEAESQRIEAIRALAEL